MTLRAKIRHASLLVYSVGRTTGAPWERGNDTFEGIDRYVCSRSQGGGILVNG